MSIQVSQLLIYPCMQGKLGPFFSHSLLFLLVMQQDAIFTQCLCFGHVQANFYHQFILRIFFIFKQPCPLTIATYTHSRLHSSTAYCNAWMDCNHKSFKCHPFYTHIQRSLKKSAWVAKICPAIQG